MYNEFNVIFGFDELKKIGKQVPPSPLEGADFLYSPPSADSKRDATAIMRKRFANDILGDSFAQLKKHASIQLAETPADTPIEAAMNMYFAKGVAGNELKRKVQKGRLDLPEAMSALLTKFQEFFTVAEQSQLQRQIKCLDVPGFLEMLNSRLEAA
jgi:hypothetical protein